MSGFAEATRSTVMAWPAATLVPVGADPQTATEQALVERARSDADAFAELYRLYLDRVHAFAYRRTGDRQAAEDITSATFEAVVRGLPSFRWHRGGIAPWIFRIASNQVAAHHRSEARSRSERGQQGFAQLAEGEAADRTADAALRDTADFAQLRRALDDLSPRYQRAIELTYLSDLDRSAAATAMGLATPAFAVVLSRARKALKAALATIDEDGGEP